MTTESITIWSGKSITKNASIVLGTPVYLGKCGPDAEYYADITASGGGNISVTYQVGMESDDTFYTPGNATAVIISMLSPPTSASRDYFSFTPYQAPWMKFKCKENNASPVVVDMNLVVLS